MTNMAASTKKPEIREDVWIHTQCRRCQSMCGMLAHRVNGVLVRLEGDPNTSAGSGGGLCAKGLAGIQLLYDPNRLKVPLRRTNPEKGIGVDPKWQEITWDEALDEIAARLKKTMDEDPRLIMLQGGIMVNLTPLTSGLLNMILTTPKGHPLHYRSGGINCGGAGHYSHTLHYGGFLTLPDWKRCNYQLVFGTNISWGQGMQYGNRLALEALDRGMKLVVFDPVCSYAASKATDWVPIIPGTDGTVCLAMLNVIVNELGIYDETYLKYKANAAYLIGPDGLYVRDPDTKNPMVWDPTASKARTYDDPGIGDIELDGSYEVNGIKCRPAWQAMKEHFKKYTPEKASEISSVPSATIRRIATEFAEAASVGSTITIDGKQLPFRPVGTLHCRGALDHKNATNTVHAIELLPHILGAANVPGGNISLAAEFQGYPGTGSLNTEIRAGYDGYLESKGNRARGMPSPSSMPPREPQYPHDKGLGELFVMGWEGAPVFGVSDRDEIWRKAKVDPKIEIILSVGRNDLLSSEKPSHVVEFLKKVPFIVDIELFANEFNEGFADILLPDTCYLEYSDWGTVANHYNCASSVLDDPWSIHITQKIVEPMYSRRHSVQVVIDLLSRMGFSDEINEAINNFLGLDESLKLKPDEEIDWDDLCDRVIKNYFGPEYSWEWFKEHGFITWPKQVEEVYWKYFRDGRVPVYWEFLLDVGRKMKKIGQEIGIEIDWDHYTAIPEWFPCPPHQVTDPQYDLYCIPFCDTLHVGSASGEQPWLDEASRMNPFTYTITLSTHTAEQKGLKDGDIIELESDKGNKVKGMLKVKKGQHPQIISMMNRGGHWATGMPIARGKGVGYQFLMENQLSDCDPVTWHPEPCVKVKVTRVK